jgi:hypothetical protein
MTHRRAPWLAAVLIAALPAVLSAQVSLRAIYGTSPTDLWVVGDASAALHWDGHAWNEVPFGVSRGGSLNGVWASGPRNVFVVGDGGTVLHFDGGSWSRMTVPTDHDLVAVAGRAAGDVYALAQSSNDREAAQLLHYDGHAWTATPLPLPFRANALALAGRDVVVAGYVYFDPQPTERRQAGVVARWSGGRWATEGWDGQKISDAAAGAAGWTGLSSAGSTLLLFGQLEDGTPVITTDHGATWTPLPPAASAMSRTRVHAVFLTGDATPVALYEDGGFARFAGGRWAVVSAQAAMMQMYGQAPPGATPEQQQAAAARQQQLMAQLQANPMLMAARMQAYSLGSATGLWGPAATDFYVVTQEGRIIHVVGEEPSIVYDTACADPASAGMNPICQAIKPGP